MSSQLKPSRRRPKPTPRENTATSLALLALAPEAWTPCLYVGRFYALPGPRSPFTCSPSLSASACVSDMDGSLSLTVNLHIPGGRPTEDWARLRKDVQDFLLARGFDQVDLREPRLRGEDDEPPDLGPAVELDFRKPYEPGPEMQRELAEVDAFLSRFEEK